MRIRSRGPAAILATLILLGACARNTSVDMSRVEDRIRDILALHTMEHVYRDVVYFGEQESFLFIRTVDRSVLFSVDIRVLAGIDLSEGVEVFRDAEDDEAVYVRLPEARILFVDADEDSIEQYFVRERGGTIGWLEYGAQIERIKEKNAQDAIDRGILERAEANARAVLRNFLELAGFSSVVFLPGPSSEGGDGGDL